MSRSLLGNAMLVAAGALLACLVFVGSAAMAGTGVGDVFNLGQTNTVDQRSTLTGNAGTAPGSTFSR